MITLEKAMALLQQGQFVHTFVHDQSDGTPLWLASKRSLEFWKTQPSDPDAVFGFEVHLLLPREEWLKLMEELSAETWSVTDA